MTIQRFNSNARLSQTVVHNGTVYLTGQVSDADGITAQTEAVTAQIDALLREAGTDKSRILNAIIWLTDLDDFDAMNVVWERWLAGGPTPSRSTSKVTLLEPGFRIEITITAAV